MRLGRYLSAAQPTTADFSLGTGRALRRDQKSTQYLGYPAIEFQPNYLPIGLLCKIADVTPLYF